jgi:hypothetical protein
VPCKVGDRKKQIADLVFDEIVRRGGRGLFDFGEFLADLGDDLVRVRPVEADLRGLAGVLAGAGDGG